MHQRIWIVLLTALAVGLTGCASPAPDNSKGRYKVGKPYSIKGQTYYPEENYEKEQIGMASWYGPGFHGKKTANGERFDQMALTAAHPTLQMPSLVRVTNLSNNESVVVRINDRGPFHGGRIIDLSKGAAEALKFRNMGTSKVKVQVLGPESIAVAQAARKGVDTRGAEIAMNDYGMLDQRFAAFYPTNMTAPAEPHLMVASTAYVPAAPLDPALGNANTIAVPPVGDVIAEQIAMIEGVPVPPQRPAQLSAQPSAQPSVVMPVQAQPMPQIHVPVQQPQIYQMSPVMDDTRVQGMNPANIPAPILPNALPKRAVFKGLTKPNTLAQNDTPAVQ